MKELVKYWVRVTSQQHRKWNKHLVFYYGCTILSPMTWHPMCLQRDCYNESNLENGGNVLSLILAESSRSQRCLSKIYSKQTPANKEKQNITQHKIRWPWHIPTTHNFITLALPKKPFHDSYEQNSDKTQPWWSPTLTSYVIHPQCSATEKVLNNFSDLSTRD